MSYHALAYDLTARCHRAGPAEVKAACRAIDPRLRETALRFFFESDEWKQHRRLWRRVEREQAAWRQQTGERSYGGLGLARQAIASADALGPSLDACTEALAERFRDAVR